MPRSGDFFAFRLAFGLLLSNLSAVFSYGTSVARQAHTDTDHMQTCHRFEHARKACPTPSSLTTSAESAHYKLLAAHLMPEAHVGDVR